MLEQKQLLQSKVLGNFYPNFWEASSFRIAQKIWRITHFPQWLLCLSVLYWLAQGARSSGGEAVVVNVRTSFLFLSFFPCFSRGSLLSVTVSMIPHIQSFTLIFTHCLNKWFPFAGSWFWTNKLVRLPIANQSPQFVPEEWWEGTMMLYIAFYILSGIWINTIPLLSLAFDHINLPYNCKF